MKMRATPVLEHEHKLIVFGATVEDRSHRKLGAASPHHNRGLAMGFLGAAPRPRCSAGNRMSAVCGSHAHKMPVSHGM